MPSGASTGAHEAVEMRDGDKSAIGGKGVLRRSSREREILDALQGIEATEQRRIDKAMIDAGRHAKTRAGSAPTRSSACRWPWRRPRASRSGCRSTAIWAASMRARCRCR